MTNKTETQTNRLLFIRKTAQGVRLTFGRPAEKTQTETETLSANQLRFVRAAKRAGLKVEYGYSGRGMFGTTCPSVYVDRLSDFRTRSMSKWDNLGKGFVIYAPF